MTVANTATDENGERKLKYVNQDAGGGNADEKEAAAKRKAEEEAEAVANDETKGRAKSEAEAAAKGNGQVDDEGAGLGNRSDEPDPNDAYNLGEAAPEDDGDSSVIRELRKRHRDGQKENKQLRQRLEQVSGNAGNPAEQEPGPEPSMDDEAIDYDEPRFKAAWRTWNERTQQKSNRETQRRMAEEEHQKLQNEQDAKYAEEKNALGEDDFDDIEGLAKSTLTDVQVQLIKHAADEPARLLYALGRQPQIAERLAKMGDHAKFTFAVSKLEGNLPKKAKSPTPPPEKRVKGNASVAGTGDKTLERLEAEAAKTGNRTAVIAHKRRIREAKR